MRMKEGTVYVTASVPPPETELIGLLVGQGRECKRDDDARRMLTTTCEQLRLSQIILSKADDRGILQLISRRLSVQPKFTAFLP